jgi:hypothetical protein
VQASVKTAMEKFAEHTYAGAHAPAEPVDTTNVVKAMERTPGRVVFVDSNAEVCRRSGPPPG